MGDPIEQFREALSRRGIIAPGEIIADGRIHRCDAEGKNGKGDAAYLLHLNDVPAGGFQNWRDGQDWEDWRADLGRSLTVTEREAQRAKAEATRCEREAEEARRHGEARERAAATLKDSKPASADHAYLKAKGIRVHGLRQSGGALVLPMRDASGNLNSLQFIREDGTKRFLTGGRVRGCYFGFGKPDGTLCVAEGYATGASIFEATGFAVAVAFEAGNLEPVAQALRAKFPDARLILCADDDAATKGNPGLAKATAAARAVGGLLAVPDFGENRPDGVTDFNDLALHRGAEAVRKTIEAARAPAGPDLRPTLESAAVGATASHEWPEPQPLPEGLPPVDPFDFALLPETLRPWAEDICDRVQCPPDYVGVTILAALGSLIGRKVSIRPQAQTDWTVTPNQWALIVGRPGVLKSPAMEQALSPLKRIQSAAVEAHRAATEEHTQAARLARLRAEAAEKAAREKLKKNPNADLLGELVGGEPEPPSLARYIATDATAAALGELHRQNPNGLLVYRDELVSLLKTLDREDSAEARGFYLTGWNGDSPYTFDRIGRGMNLHIPAVCLSLLGSTQPGRIAEYLRAAVRGGTGDDGLIQRFGLLVWPDTSRGWHDVDRWPDSQARRKANAVFDSLDRLDPQAIGAQQDEFAPAPYLRFAGDALNEFQRWREPFEAEVRGGELHPALESHLAKYRKLVPGIALILHLAAGESGPVCARPVLQALAWAEYLGTHARRAYASVTSPEVSAAKAILEKLRRSELPRIFAARDVYRHNWAHLSDREQVQEALQLLVDLDWLVVYARDTRGRTATAYEANPKWLTR